VFDSKKGGRAKLDKLDEELAGKSNSQRTTALRKHAIKHHAQQLRRPPLLPFHYVVYDPMHALHNEVNVLLDEAVHKHLMTESKDQEVKLAITTAQESINTLWKAANLAKFIQFGRDGKGAHVHTLNGPAFKDVMRNGKLLTRTIELMQPVYALLEARKLTPELQPSAVGAEADRGPGKPGGVKRDGKGSSKPKKSSKKASRLVSWADDDEPAAPVQGPPTSSSAESGHVKRIGDA
jgi:hypothetical protein